jgi:hypothetical protein
MGQIRVISGLLYLKMIIRKHPCRISLLFSIISFLAKKETKQRKMLDCENALCLRRRLDGSQPYKDFFIKPCGRAPVFDKEARYSYY